MANLGQALESARTYLNDDAAALWSDAALIPKAQEAHRELQTKLWEVGSPAVRAISSGINVTAGQTNLNGLTNYPTDMLTPFKLQETTSGGSLATAVDMTETFYLPNVTADPTLLKFWEWRDEQINVTPSGSNRTVFIYYRRLITIPQADGDSIGILFGELYISARTAAIAHGSLGNKDAYTIVTGFAEENFRRVVAAQRGQQTPFVKP